VWVELLVLVACVALAYGVARLVGRGQPHDAVWFGRRIIDGLLFPVLALIFIYAARYGLARYQSVALLKVPCPFSCHWRPSACSRKCSALLSPNRR